MNRALLQKRINHKPAIANNTIIIHLPVRYRIASPQMMNDKAVKQSHISQIFGRASMVCSTAAAGFPSPGNLGLDAAIAARQLDPPMDASQSLLLPSVTSSLTKMSHSDGGALSL